MGNGEEGNLWKIWIIELSSSNISFMPDAIHSVEAIYDEATISFNLYGETNYEQRFEFDPVTSTAKNF